MTAKKTFKRKHDNTEATRRNALKQVGVEVDPNKPLTQKQVAMAAEAARKLAGLNRKTGVGRTPVILDTELLAALSIIHCSFKEMANILKCGEEVLQKGMYREIVDENRAKGAQSLRRAQYQKAVKGGDTTMQIWLGKNILGQTDKMATEVTGANGGPIEMVSPKDMLMQKLDEIATRQQAQNSRDG